MDPLFLLHTGECSSAEQDDWEIEADSQTRVDAFCAVNPGQTIGLVPITAVEVLLAEIRPYIDPAKAGHSIYLAKCGACRCIMCELTGKECVMEIQDAKQSRPHNELIAELLDSRQPKTEREHAAVREIERLRDNIRELENELVADVHTCSTACRKTPACAAMADLREENERLRTTNKNARDAIQAGITINVELQAEVERLCAQVAALQARVDALMLEFCPDEMTEEQKETWARHQRPARRDGR